MTIDITSEKNGMRATLLIVTNSLDTHSAMQEIAKDDDRLEKIKLELLKQLNELLYLTAAHRKS